LFTRHGLHPRLQVIELLASLTYYQCFLHWKEQGGQDHALQFRGGLTNYKAHGDLPWFWPLLGGNGVSWELEKFTWWRKWISLYPFYR
jgi:hypothetical protein